MVDTQEMLEDLRSKTGIDFDKAILENLTVFYETTIETMRLAEQNSQNSELISLTRDMISDLEKHIRDMQQLLGGV
jgi:uncharacterized protein (DUF305 family)